MKIQILKTFNKFLQFRLINVIKSETFINNRVHIIVGVAEEQPKKNLKMKNKKTILWLILVVIGLTLLFVIMVGGDIISNYVNNTIDKANYYNYEVKLMNNETIKCTYKSYSDKYFDFCENNVTIYDFLYYKEIKENRNIGVQ